LRTQSAETAVRIIARYSLALFPFVEGEPGRWGEQLSAPECRALVTLLADLHAGHWATCAVPRRDMEIPGRRRLEEALGETNRHWHGGPFSEPTRQEVAKSRGVVLGGLDTFDALAAQLSGSPFAPVVTHGEPHAGNLIRRDDGFALVDWDTVALDRPERDSWMVDDGSGAAWATYEELTGRAVDRDAVRLYRLLWELSDVAAFTAQLQKHELGFFFFNNWISINNDPFYHLYWLYRSDCCNYTNYSNPTVQKLIDDNLLSTDATTRQQAAMECQKLILQDAPMAYLYQPDKIVAMGADVKGYIFYPADLFTRYKYLSK